MVVLLLRCACRTRGRAWECGRPCLAVAVAAGLGGGLPQCCCMLYLCTCCTAVQNVPVANAKPDDIQDLLGGALFKALYKWMLESGPVYLLPTGQCLCGALDCAVQCP